jgi:NitT/TauT family transport system substrate-binding protein
MVVAGCGGDDEGGSGSSESADLGDGEPGEAEDTEITVAIPFPDITMYSMYLVGTDMGYYEEEGISVEVITADNVNAAVASGSADIGVESAGSVIEAIRGGVEVELLGGHYCRQNFDFATQPDITEVDQLDGTSVVLAGTSGDPAEFQRARVLAEQGWDLDSVDVEIVYPGPDSATWREFFVADKVSLIPFYGDDRPALEEYGANIIIESLQNWANDVQIAGTSWLEDNPNTAVRFLRATMKALDYMAAPGIGEVPENKDAVLDIYEANDFDVADLRSQDSPWVLDGHLICPNLYFDEDAWNTTIETQELEELSFADNVDLSYLEKAQELLELDNTLAPDDLTYP